MRDSKLYSTQDIEKLKQRLESYRETLSSLKMGTSIEDYLLLKKDFEDIKTQIAHLEGLKETLEDEPNIQIKGYEEQIKLLTTQIESLNQTIEEMNQDILIVLNKIMTIEDTDVPTPIPKTENTSTFMTNSAQRNLTITPTADQSGITSKLPSYKMLQGLAGKAANMQSNINNDIPPTRQENQRNNPKERHFNHHYFQSVNTHPGQIYNGLYKNNISETTIHFKHTTNAQELPVNVYEPNTLSPKNNESTDNNVKKSSNIEKTVNYEEPPKIDNIVDEINAEITNEPVDINKSSALKSEEMEGFEAPVEGENETYTEIEAFEASAEEENETYTEIEAFEASAEGENETYTEIEAFEASAEEENETYAGIEEVNKQPVLIEKAAEEEHKKARNSSFLNFFRKWS